MVDAGRRTDVRRSKPIESSRQVIAAMKAAPAEGNDPVASEKVVDPNPTRNSSEIFPFNSFFRLIRLYSRTLMIRELIIDRRLQVSRCAV